jgi:hypothetical protein
MKSLIAVLIFLFSILGLLLYWMSRNTQFCFDPTICGKTQLNDFMELMK